MTKAGDGVKWGEAECTYRMDRAQVGILGPRDTVSSLPGCLRQSKRIAWLLKPWSLWVYRTVFESYMMLRGGTGQSLALQVGAGSQEDGQGRVQGLWTPGGCLHL